MAAPSWRSSPKKAPTPPSLGWGNLATCYFREPCSAHFWSKSSTGCQDRMGAPPRRTPIETGVPPFAPPWPIYPGTIFSRVWVFALKRGGGWGNSVLMVKSNLDGQIIRIQKKRPSRKKSGKVKALSIIHRGTVVIVGRFSGCRIVGLPVC